MTRPYSIYCPVAHSLEVVGDRWTLLIIQYLLPGPQRFTDLIKRSNNITAKWLMLRLRKLEETGIVEHEKRQDRREVWYKLTQAGYDLRPVVEALAQWGLRYVMGPPLPGEMVHPESAVNIFKESLNNRGKKLAQPATWLLKFAPGGQFSLFFDGDRWSVNGASEKNPDVIVTTTPEMWATFLSARRSERGRLARALRIDGAPVSVREFLYTLGVRDGTAN